ncbi:TNF receptor-associated factor 6-B-like [Oopsacas minuta]|uniref:TNF receptor-associated factor 6-B-like n=1 Tax=Oopsacas minuta TaxID=111878 RepID=A0AAV7JZU4_9METZ|nr:TNF receptor-associated factor 6-B-like [Oopsacas minuta]
MCPLNTRGCNWKGQLKQIDEHLPRCEQLKIPYNLKCQTVLAQCEVKQHQAKSCPMRKITCEYCDVTLLAKDLKIHMTNCPMMSEDCPEGCGMKLLRNELKEHINNMCELKKVSCLYYNLGCKTLSITRKELKEHNNNR